MSFILNSENGYVADLASNMGYGEMTAYVEHAPGAQVLKDFFDQGWTDDPEGCVQDIAFLLSRPNVEDNIFHTLQALAKNLGKVKEVAIVSQ